MRCLVPLLAVLLGLPISSHAQRRPIDENVTYGYAQVLRVSPVYENVIVRLPEQRCRESGGPPAARCQRVEREERKLTGFDVEYQYKGEKYMSRLPSDPGSRLRVRVSVVPDDRVLGER